MTYLICLFGIAYSLGRHVALCSLAWNAGGAPTLLMQQMWWNASLVSRPPPFLVLQFAFSIIHGSGRAYTERKLKNKKRGRPGNEASGTSNARKVLCATNWSLSAGFHYSWLALQNLSTKWSNSNLGKSEWERFCLWVYMLWIHQVSVH